MGANFNETVLDESKDVFIKFYAPYCTHCKAFAPVWEKLAEKIHKVNKEIRFAEMDMTLNEVEGLFVDRYPSLKLYTTSGKQRPIDFEGDRTEEVLVEFLKEKATYFHLVRFAFNNKISFYLNKNIILNRV